jgi:ankyrin repeat protein
MYVACQGGHLGAVQLLLDRGADLDEPYVNGWTPLHWAVRNGHGQVAQFLLEHGADPAVRAKDDGKTALEVAAAKGLQVRSRGDRVVCTRSRNVLQA